MTYRGKLQRNVTLAYITNFLTALIFTIPVWVAFQTRVMDFTQIAFLSALAYAVRTFLELPTGALADLIGRKKTIMLGWLICGLANIYISLASSFIMFFAGFMAEAIGAVLVSGADTALIYDTFKELNKEDYFTKYMARGGFIYRLGLVLATFLGGYLYQKWIGLPYFLMGAIQLVAIIFIFLMVEPRIDSEKFTLKSYLGQTRDGFREIFKTAYMKKLTVYYMFVGGITWSCLYYFNQPFAKNLGYSELEQSWLFSALYLATSSLIIYLASKAGLLSRKTVYLAFPIIMIVSLVPGYFVSKAIAPILLFGVMLCGSSRFAILDRYANQEFLSKYRATAVSSLNMLVSIFYILVVGASGKIQDVYGTGLIFSLLGLASLLIVLPVGIALVRQDDGSSARAF